jgi:DNA-binding transcriptional ArsR family regulator
MINLSERMVVSETPNFYIEAVHLMNEYFQWANRSKEETNEITTWEEMHLVDHAENFTISSSDVDSLYHDVYQFLYECKRDAAKVLVRRKELQPYFDIKPLEHAKEMPGFLKVSLLMSDIRSTEALTMDEFTTCCLLGLEELADTSQLEALDIGSSEEQALYEKLGNPDFDMSEIFHSVNATSLSDREQMILLRFFQDIDTYYENVKSTLLQLEEICRRHFALVENRFEAKIEKLKTKDGKTFYRDFINKAKFHIEDFRVDDPIHLEVSIVSYGSLSIRFFSWNRLKLRICTGLLFEDLRDLEDKNKYRDKVAQRQLKAIADPTRYKILRQLSIRPHYVQELADSLDLTAATLSHHLAHLLQVMLVGVSVEGRKSYYSLNSDELTHLSETLRNMAERSKMEE